MVHLAIDFRVLDDCSRKWERGVVAASEYPSAGQKYAVLLFGYFASWYRYKAVCRKRAKEICYELHLVGSVAELLGFPTQAVEIRIPDIDRVDAPS